MYNIDQPNAKDRDELRAIAKEMEIVGRGKMNKAELVTAIFDNQPFEDEKQPEPAAEEVVVEEKTTEKVENTNVEKPKHKKAMNEVDAFRKENHRKIVEACEVGDIVAFNCGGTKARSAKVTRKSTKREKLEVETAYGRKFIIDFDMVIWVKKSPDAKWPHGVYKALKGIE